MIFQGFYGTYQVHVNHCWEGLVECTLHWTALVHRWAIMDLQTGCCLFRAACQVKAFQVCSCIRDIQVVQAARETFLLCNPLPIIGLLPTPSLDEHFISVLPAFLACTDKRYLCLGLVSPEICMDKFADACALHQTETYVSGIALKTWKVVQPL